ncbi:MAG: leucine-rich repeat domain-containing protein, partial [Ruminococcus sp.]|nr:leucine-rich repeat domain-containing protein [Ruminococcus sp.]
MKKKIFSGLLSLAMMFDCLAMSDVAFEAKAYETCGGYWYIVLEDGTAEIIKYVGREEEVVIPETLNGYTVTVIGTTTGSVTIGAFEAQCDIYSVVIPDTVISIKENAFSECYYLADITIPSSVTNIHSTAFDYTMSVSYIHL